MSTTAGELKAARTRRWSLTLQTSCRDHAVARGAISGNQLLQFISPRTGGLVTHAWSVILYRRKLVRSFSQNSFGFLIFAMTPGDCGASLSSTTSSMSEKIARISSGSYLQKSDG